MLFRVSFYLYLSLSFCLPEETISLSVCLQEYQNCTDTTFSGYLITPWSSAASEIHFLCPEKFTLGQCMIRTMGLQIFSQTRYHWIDASRRFKCVKMNVFSSYIRKFYHSRFNLHNVSHLYSQSYNTGIKILGKIKFRLNLCLPVDLAV